MGVLVFNQLSAGEDPRVEGLTPPEQNLAPQVLILFDASVN